MMFAAICGNNNNDNNLYLFGWWTFLFEKEKYRGKDTSSGPKVRYGMVGVDSNE